MLIRLVWRTRRVVRSCCGPSSDGSTRLQRGLIPRELIQDLKKKAGKELLQAGVSDGRNSIFNLEWHAIQVNGTHQSTKYFTHEDTRLFFPGWHPQTACDAHLPQFHMLWRSDDNYADGIRLLSCDRSIARSIDRSVHSIQCSVRTVVNRKDVRQTG